MTVGLKRPGVDVVFLPMRPLEDELLAWMAYKTTTMYAAFAVPRELLGLPDQDGIRVVPDPTMPPGSFEIRSGAQRVRVVNVFDGEEKPLDRFAAVVLEMEMIK